MIKIGVISDTHGYFDDRLRDFLANVDEIWHAGDIGSLELADSIDEFKPMRAVFGNIDGAEIRQVYPEILEFQREDVKIAISHIVGYPGKYSTTGRELLKNKPKILVAGHSHILKVIYDTTNELLFLNPGAAGVYGFHTVRTALRFDIAGAEIKNLELAEWKKQC
ncbi:MAG: metallophosphatase family protein [Prevotellaceae bacterium]|jgi:putative phosphoesterase|nr:metallophosphatase family protein [Prevotellaceae bacterium]